MMDALANPDLGPHPEMGLTSREAPKFILIAQGEGANGVMLQVRYAKVMGSEPPHQPLSARAGCVARGPLGSSRPETPVLTRVKSN